MPKLDPRTDAKIKAAPEFARPILAHIRALAHKGCPETEEALPPGKQREYVAWLVDAKTEATREKRLAQALGPGSLAAQRHQEFPMRQTQEKRIAAAE